MAHNHKIVIFLLTGFLTIFGFFVSANSVKAATSTVVGKAYWGIYGYIYFNCADDVIGNRFDEANNLAGGTRYISPAEAAFHFYSEPCTDLIHGVTVDVDKRMGGQAWNPSLGLIDFEGNFAPNHDFNSHCPKCVGTCTACYDESAQKMYGWARIASTSELIRLDSALTPPVMLYLDVNNNPFPGYNMALGDFAGKASSPRGNVDFNCETENYPGVSNCATRQYKVYIKDLILSKLSAPNWSYGEACSSGALKAVLKWQKMSGTQTAYEIVVNDAPSFNTTTADYVCWSGKKLSSSAVQYTIPNSDPNCGALAYNTPYYWWIRGFDNNNEPTEWRQYDSNNSITSTDKDLDNNPLTFETFKHEFPSPFFTWSPFDVTTGTTTSFNSTGSVYYTDAAPTTAQDCVSGPCLYTWSTSDLLATTSSLSGQNIDINFFTATNTSVTLAIADAANYTCSFSIQFRINYDLPLWHEIKAE